MNEWTQEYNAETDRSALKAIENITENAAKILRMKNLALTITTRNLKYT